MLITGLKRKDDISPLIDGTAYAVVCGGCRELHFPEAEAAEMLEELSGSGKLAAAITTDYICNPENLKLQLSKQAAKLESAGTVLVFSCGVGVQTVAELYPDKAVFAACDTYPLPGHQGFSPIEYDCAQCGECYLNDTGGICPITACSKSLVNGQCGGAKSGMCEVDKEMECGWERIYRRLEKLNRLEALRHPVSIRDFTAGTAQPEPES